MHPLCAVTALAWCDAANLPQPVGALLGGLEKGTPQFDKAAKEAARTIPGREHGGNCDIKNLTRGCKVSLPLQAWAATAMLIWAVSPLCAAKACEQQTACPDRTFTGVR